MITFIQDFDCAFIFLLNRSYCVFPIPQFIEVKCCRFCVQASLSLLFVSLSQQLFKNCSLRLASKTNDNTFGIWRLYSCLYTIIHRNFYKSIVFIRYFLFYPIQHADGKSEKQYTDSKRNKNVQEIKRTNHTLKNETDIRMTTIRCVTIKKVNVILKNHVEARAPHTYEKQYREFISESRIHGVVVYVLYGSAREAQAVRQQQQQHTDTYI